MPADWTDIHGLCQTDGRTSIPTAEDPLLRATRGESTPETEVIVRNQAVEGATVAIGATALLDDEGKLAGGIALLRDVTQQRNLERQFAQAQKMDAIGRLAGGVAHDFNNLLAVIHSYTELALKQADVPSNTREDFERGARRRPTGGGTDSSAAGGQSPPGRSTQEPSAQRRGRRSRQDVAPDHREDIDLVTRPSPALGTVKADSGQIEQIILNLTVNARDAMPTGGKLTVETANVTLTEDYTGSPPGSSLEIS